MIKTYATNRDTSSVFYVSLIDHILKTNKSFILSKGFFNFLNNFINNLFCLL